MIEENITREELDEDTIQELIALGAEINGIDLKDTSLENFKKINKLFLEHKVLFFRNQNITIEEQLSLGKHFGPSEKHPYLKQKT